MAFTNIDTKRLILRFPSKDDIPAIARLMNDPAIARFYGEVRYPATAYSVWKWYKQCINPNKPYVSLPYVAVLKSNPRIIVGAAHLTLFPGQPAPTFGYWLGKDYRRKRFASEIARALIRAVFTETGTMAIVGFTPAANGATHRVLKSIGFDRVGYGWISYKDPLRKERAINFVLRRKRWLEKQKKRGAAPEDPKRLAAA